ncbi:MAG: hypothetical protein KJZ72_05115 [Anaerolineales bacterium]|nr:hypothetical protein [Anaerolineales bacterium]
MTVDLILQTLQAIGYITLLLVLTLLWYKTFHQSKQMWGWLAVAWTMNLLGNIAWVFHDLVTGTMLDTFSAVDLFFVLRYVLIGFALWLHPISLSRRDGVWIGAAVFVANAMVWTIYFNPAMKLRGGDWVGFLGLAMYPVLDAGIIMLVWRRIRSVSEAVWRRQSILLFFSMASYGIANTINLTEYVFSLTSNGILQNVFWILTDVFVLVMAPNTSSGQKIQS